MLPRRPVARVLLGALTVVAVVHLAAQLTGGERLADATQVLLMPLLGAVLSCDTSAPRSRLAALVLVALGLSWLGDSAPKLVEGDAAFLVMVGFFLLAQVAYIAAFLPYRDRSVLHVRRPLLLLYAGAVAALIAACAGGAGALLAPVLVYGAGLGAMAVLSTGVNVPTAVGGALFLVSDGLIALGAFASAFTLPAEGFWVMATYIAAQVLIVAGVLREEDRSHPSPTLPDAVRAR